MPASALSGKKGALRDTLGRMKNAMNAIILRDMRTRFFNHGLGFLIVSLFPLIHMFMLLGIYQLVGRQPFFGESMRVFFATGLVPALLFIYVSRGMAMSVAANSALFSFPAVRIFDALVARAFLEVTAAFITLVLMISLLWLLGDDPVPRDPHQAVLAYLATILLALGVGSIVGLITIMVPPFLMFYNFMIIFIYFSSGIIFVAHSLPEQVTDILAFNPLLHSVEWVRTSFYDGYSDKLLNKTYLVGFGVSSLLLGLAGERLLRRRILDG